MTRAIDQMEHLLSPTCLKGFFGHSTGDEVIRLAMGHKDRQTVFAQAFDTALPPQTESGKKPGV